MFFGCGCNRCGFNRCRCNRFEESSDIRRRRVRREESSDDNNRNRNRNTFRVESFFDQNDFCRAVRRCNQRDRNRNRRHDNW